NRIVRVPSPRDSFMTGAGRWTAGRSAPGSCGLLHGHQFLWRRKTVVTVLEPSGEIGSQMRGAVERGDHFADPSRVDVLIALQRPLQGLREVRSVQVLRMDPSGQAIRRHDLRTNLLFDFAPDARHDHEGLAGEQGFAHAV